ncbi:MAG TPA: 50S ribosomal protein L23 [Firmicutes bacterium]|jgi:large subunit ribosomal protein L23|nr:50S ribosomal protein L23 [Bacillota bacterium]
MRDARDIILRPVVSERSTEMMEQRKYTFVVADDANKIEIAKAVETIFKVKVESVNTMRVQGKLKRNRYGYKRTPSWKKAIVTLTEDSKTIPILETV